MKLPRKDMAPIVGCNGCDQYGLADGVFVVGDLGEHRGVELEHAHESVPDLIHAGCLFSRWVRVLALCAGSGRPIQHLEPMVGHTSKRSMTAFNRLDDERGGSLGTDDEIVWIVVFGRVLIELVAIEHLNIATEIEDHIEIEVEHLHFRCGCPSWRGGDVDIDLVVGIVRAEDRDVPGVGVNH